MLHIRKKFIIVLFSLGLVLLLLLIIKPNRVISSLSSIDIILICLALSITPIQFILRTFRWKMILDSMIQTKISFRVLAIYNSIGIYGSAITPSKIGDLVKSVLLIKYYKVKSYLAIYSAVVDRVTDITVLFIFSGLGITQIVLVFSEMSLNFLLPYLFLGFILLVALFILFNEKVGNRAMLYIINIFTTKVVRKLSKMDLNSYFSLDKEDLDFNITRKNLFLAFLISTCIWILYFTQVMLVFNSLGVSVDFIWLPGFISLALIISLIPVTVSGLGTRESSFIILFSLISILPEISFICSLLITTIAQWSVALFGAVLGAKEIGKLTME